MWPGWQSAQSWAPLGGLEGEGLPDLGLPGRLLGGGSSEEIPWAPGIGKL